MYASYSYYNAETGTYYWNDKESHYNYYYESEYEAHPDDKDKFKVDKNGADKWKYYEAATGNVYNYWPASGYQNVKDVHGNTMRNYADDSTEDYAFA